MSRVSPDLFASCYEDVRSRRCTIAECVDAHPEVGPELGELLDLAQAIAGTPAVNPDPVFRFSGREALLQTIADERGGSAASAVLRRLLRLAGGSQPLPVSGLRRAALPVALVLALLLTIVGGGATYAARDSLPGDSLYGVKLVTEDARVQLALSDIDRARLHLDLAGTRLAELERLAARDRLGQAAGLVEAYEAQLARAEQRAEAVAFGDEETRQQELLRARTLLQEQAERLARLQKDVPADFAPGLARAAERAQGLPFVAEERWHVGAGQPVDSSPPQPRDVPAEGATSAALAQLAQAVEALADEPLLPGNSQKGLLAKVRSVEDAVARGQPAVALNALAAFENELEAAYKDGHLPDATYKSLLDLNDQVASDLSPRVAPGGEKDPGADNETKAMPPQHGNQAVGPEGTPPGQNKDKMGDPDDKGQGRKP